MKICYALLDDDGSQLHYNIVEYKQDEMWENFRLKILRLLNLHPDIKDSCIDMFRYAQGAAMPGLINLKLAEMFCKLIDDNTKEKI